MTYQASGYCFHLCKDKYNRAVGSAKPINKLDVDLMSELVFVKHTMVV